MFEVVAELELCDPQLGLPAPSLPAATSQSHGYHHGLHRYRQPGFIHQDLSHSTCVIKELPTTVAEIAAWSTKARDSGDGPVRTVRLLVLC